MKVELSIRDDRELRQHIRDVIKGEIVSIARGEIDAILAEVVGKRVGQYDAIRSLVRDTVNGHVEAALGRYNISANIKAIAREEAAKLIKVSLKDSDN